MISCKLNLHILLDLNALPNVSAVSFFLSPASTLCVQLHGTSEPKTFISVSQRKSKTVIAVGFRLNNKTMIFIQDIFLIHDYNFKPSLWVLNNLRRNEVLWILDIASS